MIPAILTYGASGLLILAFAFVAAFMVRGILKAIKGEAILPAEIGPEEGKKLLEVEKAAREALDGETGEKPAALLSLAVTIHELDSARDRAKLKKIEDGVDKDR